MIVQEPIGVVAAVSPWNFPVDIAGIPVVYGLALVCTTVWKPSGYAPLCAEMFVQMAPFGGAKKSGSGASCRRTSSTQ